jgi:hypothetical protein
VQQLLIMSLIKFQILKDSGKWNSLSPGQEQIAALASDVTTLNDHNLKLANSAQPPKNKHTGEKSNGAGKGKKPSKKAADDEKWAWKKVPPKEVGPNPSRCLTSTKFIIGKVCMCFRKYGRAFLLQNQ